MPRVPRDPVAASAAAAWLNGSLNLLWSVLALSPVYLFCERHLRGPCLWLLLAVSGLPFFLPASRLRHIQLSSSPALYRRLGVPLVQVLSQHGTLASRLHRRSRGGTTYVLSHGALLRLERATYHRERFHLAAFLFFAFTTLVALLRNHLGWALLLLLCNITYNLYPIWLQQYLRLRLQGALAGRRPAPGPPSAHARNSLRS